MVTTRDTRASCPTRHLACINECANEQTHTTAYCMGTILHILQAYMQKLSGAQENKKWF